MRRAREAADGSPSLIEGVRLGPPASQLRYRVGGQRAFLVHRRVAVVTVLALAAALAVVVASVLFGAYNISAADALHTLLTGAGSKMDRFFVLNQRLPRAVAAVLVGAMLALSGAVFQSLSRNPLGSPDIVGFTTGASTGGLFMLLLAASASDLQVSAGAVVGGFVTAGAVALVSRRGGVGGDNLVLTGVAISEMLSAANSYLISQASLPSAEAAKAWQYGSFNAISWGQVKPLALAAVVLLSQVVWLVRPAGLLEMGDDAATSLGLRVGRVRGAMLGYGVVLAAICVATAGPIGFIALAAPQLARRLSRSAGITMIASASMGALLLGGADFLAHRSDPSGPGQCCGGRDLPCLAAHILIRARREDWLRPPSGDRRSQAAAFLRTRISSRIS